MGADHLVQTDPETHPVGAQESFPHVEHNCVCDGKKMTFPEIPWCLLVCKGLNWPDSRINKGQIE